MGGVDTWGEITVDEKRGIVYLPVASPKYELYGGDRHGNNLFADCLIALDARTGKYLWHFQTIHHDLWDYDPTAAPQLVTVQHDGKNVDAVALARKNGFLFVFDRVTGKPLWPIEERPVPKSDVPGEVTSPTQPFPTIVPAFARQSMTENDMYDAFMTPEERVQWKERLANARNGLYTPPAMEDTILMPSVNGRRALLRQRRGPDQRHRLCGSKDMPSILKLVPAGESTASNTGGLIPRAAAASEICRRAAEHQFPAIQAEEGRASTSRAARSVMAGTQRRPRSGDRYGRRATRRGRATQNVIAKGKGAMPALSILAPQVMGALLAFLDQAGIRSSRQRRPRPDSRRRAGNRRIRRVTPPPSRYKTGYGNEPYVITPPWSSIVAYDLNTGKIKWRTPYGDLPEAGPSDKLRGNVTPRADP